MSCIRNVTIRQCEKPDGKNRNIIAGAYLGYKTGLMESQVVHLPLSSQSFWMRSFGYSRVSSEVLADCVLQVSAK